MVVKLWLTLYGHCVQCPMYSRACPGEYSYFTICTSLYAGTDMLLHAWSSFNFPGCGSSSIKVGLALSDFETVLHNTTHPGKNKYDVIIWFSVEFVALH